MTQLSVCREGVGEGGREGGGGKEGRKVGGEGRRGGKGEWGEEVREGGGRRERGKIHCVCKCLLIVLFINYSLKVTYTYSEC